MVGTFASGAANFLASTFLELGTWTGAVSSDGAFVKLTMSGPGTPFVIRDDEMSAGTISATMAHAFASWIPVGALGPQISYVKDGLANGTQIDNIRATIDSMAASFINVLFATPGYLSNTRSVTSYQPTLTAVGLVVITYWRVNTTFSPQVFYPIFATAGGSTLASQPMGAFRIGAATPIPAQAVQILQNNRMSIYSRSQVDMADNPSVNQTALDLSGVICDSGNPSTLEVIETPQSTWVTVEDCDVDIANSQSKFSLLGRYLVTPGV